MVYPQNHIIDQELFVRHVMNEKMNPVLFVCLLLQTLRPEGNWKIFSMQISSLYYSKFSIPIYVVLFY